MRFIQKLTPTQQKSVMGRIQEVESKLLILKKEYESTQEELNKLKVEYDSLPMFIINGIKLTNKSGRPYIATTSVRAGDPSTASKIATELDYTEFKLFKGISTAYGAEPAASEIKDWNEYSEYLRDKL